jgi:hypothetical protein
MKKQLNSLDLIEAITDTTANILFQEECFEEEYEGKLFILSYTFRYI